MLTTTERRYRRSAKVALTPALSQREREQDARSASRLRSPSPRAHRYTQLLVVKMIVEMGQTLENRAVGADQTLSEADVAGEQRCFGAWNRPSGASEVRSLACFPCSLDRRGSHLPSICRRVPGVAHSFRDHLSTRFAPSPTCV